MNTFVKVGLASTFAYAAMGSISFAQVSSTATADLNVRSGPGPQYEVVDVIPSNEQATIVGCLDGSKWCQVEYGGTTGWAYSDYLVTDAAGERVVLTERRTAAEVPVVTYERDAGGTISGAATGAVAGALLGGPIGAAVGGVAGAMAGTALEPTDRAVTYVRENRVEPVYLEGEVVVGAGVPETVELRPIPDYDYEYVYVNGQPVLVDPQTREIVYVVR